MSKGTFRSYFGAICVPTLDKGDGTISNVTHDWANHAAGLGGGLAVTVVRLNVQNRRVDRAKQKLAEMAIQQGADWLFFLDDDVLPPQDTLLKMVKLWRSDPKYKIISGVYWSKSNPPVPLVFEGQMKGSKYDWTTDDLIKVQGAGAGCLFIDAKVLQAMPKPWFSCDYYFDDPRGAYDLEKWRLSDELGHHVALGKEGNKKEIKRLTKELEGLNEKIHKSLKGDFDPELFNNKSREGATTEDLYFFNKAKEYADADLWVDCSIQCMHQDKRTGRMFGLSPDMPQANPAYKGRMKPGNKVVLDIGSGDMIKWIEEGVPIRVDLDPKVEPDVVADARRLPFKDCYADSLYSSHLLEHFSFRETISVLKEWARVLKVGGEMILTIPNLKWAANNLLNGTNNQQDAERTMFMYTSAQQGDLKQAQEDVHRAGFTPESLVGVLGRVPGMEVKEYYTTDGNFGNKKMYVHTQDDLGYNILVVAKKVEHDMPIALTISMKDQAKLRTKVGKKAKSTGGKEIKKRLTKIVKEQGKKGSIKKAVKKLVKKK